MRIHYEGLVIFIIMGILFLMLQQHILVTSNQIPEYYL
jgi:hypothetical protein